MAIRFSSSCNNCVSLGEENVCGVHQVQVSGFYTCDSFAVNAVANGQRHCGTCVRYETDKCANPAKAAEGMSCTSWAPKVEVMTAV